MEMSSELEHSSLFESLEYRALRQGQAQMKSAVEG